MKQSTRWERIQVRILTGTFLVSVIPWFAITFYFGFQANGDIRLSMDSEGLPILSQLVTLLLFYFLPWVFFIALITAIAFGISSLYWYVKILRRLRFLKKPAAT